MWLITPIGFFSIVQKANDAAADTLTVRARKRGDLEALRDAYVPELGQIVEGGEPTIRSARSHRVHV